MMAEFIAGKIMEAKDEVSLVAAQKKYRNYFIKSKVKAYKRAKDECDAILIADGYDDCIVTE